MIQKANLRSHWKTLRQNISPSRRKEAKEILAAYAKTHILPKNVLSFSSFGSEIDTDSLNEWLLEYNALLLPRVEGSQLTIYRVTDLARDLIDSKWGVLQPDPDRCKVVDLNVIQTVLIPGLCFDKSFHRLGYGEGHYDRLLKNLSGTFLGIAFQEQKTDLLPHDTWDVALDSVLYC